MKNNTISVLFILDHKLMSYRVPFFTQLVERGFHITIAHPGDSLEGEFSFNQKKLIVKQIGPLEYRVLPDLSIYAVVVFMQNLRIINLWTETLNPFKKYKILHWGIGVSSSNGLELKKTPISVIRNFLAARASAQILYTDFPIELFSKRVKRKTFIANNTVFNPNPVDSSNSVKSTFLFIGSLNERKGLDLLINAFNNYLKRKKESVIETLIIIGDGPIKSDLSDLVEDLGLQKNVLFIGSITDSHIKEKFFQKAACSISPLQAGLSVLESFSYGVPFITYRNAISGGEHFNIVEGKTGYLVDSEEGLIEKMMTIGSRPEIARFLGRNAFVHYTDNRKMSDMVDSFENTFDFVLNKNR